MKGKGKDERAVTSRRGFIKGAVFGAGGAVAALMAVRKGSSSPAPPGKKETTKEPILFQRGPEAERYYRTLY